MNFKNKYEDKRKFLFSFSSDVKNQTGITGIILNADSFSGILTNLFFFFINSKFSSIAATMVSNFEAEKGKKEE